jgi:hypothetical protein
MGISNDGFRAGLSRSASRPASPWRSGGLGLAELAPGLLPCLGGFYLALGGNCGIGGLRLKLGTQRHRQRPELGVGCQHPMEPDVVQARPRQAVPEGRPSVDVAASRVMNSSGHVSRRVVPSRHGGVLVAPAHRRGGPEEHRQAGVVRAQAWARWPGGCHRRWRCRWSAARWLADRCRGARRGPAAGAPGARRASRERGVALRGMCSAALRVMGRIARRGGRRSGSALMRVAEWGLAGAGGMAAAGGALPDAPRCPSLAVLLSGDAPEPAVPQDPEDIALSAPFTPRARRPPKCLIPMDGTPRACVSI